MEWKSETVTEWVEREELNELDGLYFMYLSASGHSADGVFFAC